MMDSPNPPEVPVVDSNGNAHRLQSVPSWAAVPNLIDRLLRWAVIFIMGALVLDVLWGVTTRYLGGDQARWTEELARLLLVWVSMLGAALVYRRGGHLGVDYFVGKLHVDARRWVERCIATLVLGFAVLVLLYGGWLLVVRTLEAGQVLPALGLRKGWAYAAVPVSGLCIAIFAVEALIAGPRAKPVASAPEVVAATLQAKG